MSVRDASRPAITVGMMVHDEEPFVRRSLLSLSSQGERDFELLVVDNASTDGTESICREVARGDARVRYVRRERNRGALASFEWLIDEARGEYFVLAAGHDLWSADYLRALRGCLAVRPTAVLAFGATEWIDADDRRLDIRSGVLDTSGMHEVGRFQMVLWNNRNCLYGMHRLAALRQTSFRRRSIATESVVMQELAVRGEFAYCPEAVWRRRVVRSAETPEQRLRRYYRAGFLFEESRRPLLPYWRIPGALVLTALRSPVGRRSRIAMALVALTSLVFLRAELWSDIRRLPARLARFLGGASKGKLARRATRRRESSNARRAPA